MNTDATANLKVVLSAQDEASSVFSSFAANATKAGAGLLVVGGAITAVMADLVSKGEDAQTAMTQFGVTMTNSKGDTQDARDALLSAADAVTKLGFSHEDAELQLSKFFQQSHSVTESVQMNTTAMDLARAKNIDYATASKLVTEVMNGNTGALTRYGIVIEKSKDGMVDLNELQDQVKGSAAAFATTATGATEALNESWGDLQQTLGSLLLPLITQIAQAITPLVISITKWVEAHQTLVKNILIGVAVFGVVLTVLGSILVVVGGVIAAFGSFAALVIGGVAVAIAALVAAAALIVLNWSTVKDFFATMWDDIKKIFSDAWSWINTTVIQPMTTALDNIINKIQNSAIGKAAGAVSGAVGSAVSYVAGHLAAGGPAAAGSTYLVGENGPELFTPAVSGNVSPNGSFGGGVTVNINGGTYLSEDVARQIGNMIVTQFKRTARW